MYLKFLISQSNTLVGGLEENFKLIKKSYLIAIKKKCNFFVTTELALCGYPPRDLILRDDFLAKVLLIQKKLIALTKNQDCTMVLGTPSKRGKKIFNSVFVINNGKILEIFNKSILPNYGVFDEKRYFTKGDNKQNFIQIKNKKIGFLICEDIWDTEYSKSIKDLDFLIILNASPYEKNKYKKRISVLKKNVGQYKVPLIYCNSVGSQDDLVFDGGSFMMDKKQNILFHAPFFKDCDFIMKYNFDVSQNETIHFSYNKISNLYDALVLSFRDYVLKSGFENAIIGISGGIDSALSCSIACDAIGGSNIKSFFLPSKFTSNLSQSDTIKLCRNLNTSLDVINIEPLRSQYLISLKKVFKGLNEDITEENIQSRIRGNLLMAVANKKNSLLITTGNKSELSVGYSTIYGDMCGGYSILKDVYKTEVFELSRWRNSNISSLCKAQKKQVIPLSIIEKEPTAELKFDQKDSDTLPSYDILDKVLYYLIDQNKGLVEIQKKGFNKKMILRIWKMIKNSEFKRFQSVIGPKISEMSFDNDRRFPIINYFKL